MMIVRFKCIVGGKAKSWTVKRSTALYQKIVELQGLFSCSLPRGRWIDLSIGDFMEMKQVFPVEINRFKHQLFPVTVKDDQGRSFLFLDDHDDHVYDHNLQYISQVFDEIQNYRMSNMTFFDFFKLKFEHLKVKISYSIS